MVSADRRCVAYLSERGGVYALWSQCIGGPERMAAGVATTSTAYRWLTDGRLAVFGSGGCAGLLAVRVETDERECIVY